jgi:hypothetical protein
MAEIGFFSQTGDRYQMTVPKEASHTKIKTALLRLAATEDDSQFLHPEHLVHCLDERDTREWQLRLERLPWHRLRSGRHPGSQTSSQGKKVFQLH